MIVPLEHKENEKNILTLSLLGSDKFNIARLNIYVNSFILYNCEGLYLYIMFVFIKYKYNL